MLVFVYVCVCMFAAVGVLVSLHISSSFCTTNLYNPAENSLLQAKINSHVHKPCIVVQPNGRTYCVSDLEFIVIIGMWLLGIGQKVG